MDDSFLLTEVNQQFKIESAQITDLVRQRAGPKPACIEEGGLPRRVFRFSTEAHAGMTMLAWGDFALSNGVVRYQYLGLSSLLGVLELKVPISDWPSRLSFPPVPLGPSLRS